MKRRLPIVAIDGPAGAGKTSVSQGVARAVGFVVLDTGALYRAAAISTLRAGLGPDDPGLGEHCQALVDRGGLRMEPAGVGASRVYLEEEDVSDQIRTSEVSRRASQISSKPGVRHALLRLQREAGRDGGVVAEGRDVGSVVFPDAEAKFFLTASVELRTLRRHTELAERGGALPSLEAVRREVVDRDRRDSLRVVAPLIQAPDAVVVDSTHLSVGAVVDQIVAYVRALAPDLPRNEPCE